MVGAPWATHIIASLFYYGETCGKTLPLPLRPPSTWSSLRSSKSLLRPLHPPREGAPAVPGSAGRVAAGCVPSTRRAAQRGHRIEAGRRGGLHGGLPLYEPPSSHGRRHPPPRRRGPRRLWGTPLPTPGPRSAGPRRKPSAPRRCRRPTGPAAAAGARPASRGGAQARPASPAASGLVGPSTAPSIRRAMPAPAGSRPPTPSGAVVRESQGRWALLNGGLPWSPPPSLWSL